MTGLDRFVGQIRRSPLAAAGFASLAAVLALLVYLNLQAAGPPPEEEIATAGEVVPTEAAGAGSTSSRGAGTAATAAPPAANVDGALVAGAVSPSPAPGATHRVFLYFQGVDVGLLFPEERDAVVGPDGNSQARAVIEELTKGPTKDLLPTIPKGTRLREVYFDSTGVAYVDFSSEFRDNHSGGSAEELMTIESVVNTLTRNVPEVQAVRFLVDGRPVDTLAGHVNLASPLRPGSDRLALAP